VRILSDGALSVPSGSIIQRVPSPVASRLNQANQTQARKVYAIMRNPHLLGIALFAAVLLFSIITATSASAEVTLLAEWLIDGAAVTALTSVDDTMQSLGSDIAPADGTTCVWTIDGTVGPNGEREDTEFLNGAGVPFTLSAPALCKSDKGCEESATDIEVSPENLPWHTLVYLSEAGQFRYLVEKGSYSSSCLILGIKVTDECTETNASVEIVNVTGGVEEIGAATPLANCTVGGVESGEFVNLTGNLGLALSGTLTVSE
jgi:hypothetical protein